MKNYITFLDLGLQPLANNYLKKSQLNKKEKKYRLKIGFNPKTRLVSINKPISSKEMFNDKYPYRSSMSKTMLKSFQLIRNLNQIKYLKLEVMMEVLLKTFQKKK